MKRLLVLPALAAIVSLLGCYDHPYYAPPPPPAPIYAPPATLLDLANRNGFHAGIQDGARDAYNGYAFAPRRTGAYRDAPGYDPQLGPVEPYVNTFRNSYLAGYDKGFYRRN